MRLANGTRLGSYEIISPLGSGGMGDVYKAKDLKLGRDVAIKVLKEELASDPLRLLRFEQEAQAVAALSHPNILAIYDFGTSQGVSYAVMELLEGDTLRQRLEQGSLPIRKAINYAVQIAHGLAAAHGKGITHRDLKPGTIFVTVDGQIKILDFGLAKVKALEIGDDESPTRTRGTEPGAVIGTVGYMSPEQVRGKEVDHRTDIFSLGALLYEMLSGKRVFQADTAADTMSAILKEDPPSLSRANLGISTTLEHIIRRCLDKDPNERFQSARDLSFALESVPEITGDSGPVPAGAEVVREESPSIAVLPFADMSPQKDQDYFCEGMSEEIINALTRVEGLRVAARTSAFQFKGKTEDAGRIGQALKVKTLLEGSVRTAGNRLRVTAQLINVDDGYHLWSERYDRQMEDVFEIQDEIADSIVDALRLKLVGEKEVTEPKRHSESLEAYHLYLKGRYCWYNREEKVMEKAIGFFEQAVGLDPSYGLAYTGLADTYSILGFYGFLPPKAAFSKARMYAERALASDDHLAEAHASLGLIRHWHDWDWEVAENAFKRALELKPDYVDARCWYGWLLSTLGRHEEAEEMLRRALDTDPLSPYARAFHGLAFYYTRRHEEATSELQKAVDCDPNYIFALLCYGIILYDHSRHDEGLAFIQKAASLTKRAPMFLGFLGCYYAKSGRKDEARAILNELLDRSQKEYITPLSVALAAIDDEEMFFEWCERAYQERDGFMVEIKINARYDPYRSDPRFKELLRRMNFPE